MKRVAVIAVFMAAASLPSMASAATFSITSPVDGASYLYKDSVPLVLSAPDGAYTASDVVGGITVGTTNVTVSAGIATCDRWKACDVPTKSVGANLLSVTDGADSQSVSYTVAFPPVTITRSCARCLVGRATFSVQVGFTAQDVKVWVSDVVNDELVWGPRSVPSGGSAHYSPRQGGLFEMSASYRGAFITSKRIRVTPKLLVRNVTWTPRKFYPFVHDGYADTSTLHWYQNLSGADTITIRSDLTDKAVMKVSGHYGTGIGRVRWNGRDNKGHLVPKGDYSAVVVVRTTKPTQVTKKRSADVKATTALVSKHKTVERTLAAGRIFDRSRTLSSFTGSCNLKAGGVKVKCWPGSATLWFVIHSAHKDAQIAANWSGKFKGTVRYPSGHKPALHSGGYRTSDQSAVQVWLHMRGYGILKISSLAFKDTETWKVRI